MCHRRGAACFGAARLGRERCKSFWPVAERLAPLGYQVHLIDLPGFGQSDLPPQVWGVEDYQRFVVAYLDDRHLDRVAVLGHSFGGRIGLVLAAEHPERVSKMVLADAAGLRTLVESQAADA